MIRLLVGSLMARGRGENDVFTDPKLLFLFWVGISQIHSMKAGDGVGLCPARTISVS